MSLTEVQSQNVKWKTEKTEEERLLSDYQGLRLLQKRERSGEMDTTCIQSSPGASGKR